MDKQNTFNGFQGFAQVPTESFETPQQAPAPIAPPTTQAVSGTTILTDDQVRQYMEQLKPTPMSNPVKITEPSYVVTEKQMKYLLSLANGQPNGSFLNEPSHGFVSSIKQALPQYDQPQRPRNMLDDLGNLTFGTVGRIGHTLTGVIDGVIDIVSLGYASKR